MLTQLCWQRHETGAFAMPIRFATPDQHTLAESVQPKTSENASETTNCSLDRAPNPFLIESYDCDQLDLSAIKLNTV
jgi:hypothetical protein